MDSLHFISPVEFFFSLGSGRVSAGKIDILVIMQTAARYFILVVFVSVHSVLFARGGGLENGMEIGGYVR